MALPLPPINPNQPIPNNPFYYPDQNYIQGEYSPFIIGSGLSLNNVTGVLSASGVGASLAAGPGISLSTVGTITTIANIGVLSVTGTSPVNVTAGQNPDISVDVASTAAPGVVQLNNTTTSSSVSQALTAAAGYSLQQQIDALVISNNLTLAGTADGSTGLVATVTAEGTLKGFTVGSALPAPSATNAECFVIVTTAGTMTPPGGVTTAVNQGDWWVSDGTSWIYYPVGFDPTYATTTAPGVVQLATNAEVQAGTESTHAVTSSALQSKLSDSVNLISSTCIASSTAVRTANNAAVAAQNDATSALANAALAQSTANDALSDAAAAQFTANAAIPCACYTAKGDLLGGTGAGTFSALSPGTDGQMLYALSSAINGLQWANPPADIPCAVITAVGDIVVGSAPSTPTALPVGANGYILAANSACATGLEWVANSQGDVTSVTGTAPITVNNTDPQNPIIGASVATTGATGVVSIGTNINVTGAGAISVPAATTAAQGAVQVGTNIQVASGTISVLGATTAQPGVVQLNDTTTSASVTQALTANQGKNLQDQINALSITSNITLAGTLNTVTGNLVTVTTAGAGAGFTVGSPLPAAAAGNAEYFVIVTVAAASYTPPGGTATQTHVGDWFLSDGTVWDFLDVGFDPPYASTTTPGVVQLATNAQVQTGTDATLAVTPTGAAATYVPLADYTAKGDILAATATNTPSALPVGTDGQLLYACSAAASGLCWAPAPAAAGNATPTVAGIVLGCTTSDQVSLGCSTLFSVTTGTQNAGIGAYSLYSLTSGSQNTAVGYGAGDTLVSGSNNVIVGTTNVADPNGSCQLAIGSQGVNWITGNSTRAIKPGAGIIDCAGSCGTVGQALLSNGANAVCWGTPSAAAATPTILGTLFGCSKSTGTLGTAVGYCALAANPTGNCNVAVGPFAGLNLSTGQWNVFVGPSAGSVATTAVGSVFIGINAGVTSNGSGSIAIGNSAAAAGGPSNVAIGNAALTSANASSTRNVAIGSSSSLLGCYVDSVAVGNEASRYAGGNRNAVVGSCALLGSVGTGTTALCNSSLGYGTLAFATTACSNVAIGHAAGCGITTGSQNVLIGPNVGTSCTTQSCTLAIGYSNTALWLTGDSTNAIKPGAGIIDCAGSCGTAGQILTSNGSNAIAWATSTAPASYTANKALTSGTPINLLSWASGVRMGTLTIMTTDNSTNVKWANITIGSASGIGSSAVLTQSVGVGNFSIIAGGSGETIVRFTPSVTLASVDFVYQYTVAFGAQPSVL